MNFCVTPIVTDTYQKLIPPRTNTRLQITNRSFENDYMTHFTSKYTRYVIFQYFFIWCYALDNYLYPQLSVLANTTGISQIRQIATYDLSYDSSNGAHVYTVLKIDTSSILDGLNTTMMDSLSNQTLVKQLYNIVINNSTVPLTYTSRQKFHGLPKYTVPSLVHSIGSLTLSLVNFYFSYIEKYVLGILNLYFHRLQPVSSVIKSSVDYLWKFNIIISISKKFIKKRFPGGIILIISDVYGNPWIGALQTPDYVGAALASNYIWQSDAQTVLDEVLEAIEHATTDSFMMMGFSERLMKKGPFRGCLRLQRADFFSPIWDMPCSDFYIDPKKNFLLNQ